MRRFYSISSMVVTILLGMTACSSNDDASSDPSVSPNETVKTSFTLSVGLPQGGNSASAKPSTRVSDAVAQVDASNFRGIDNISLIPFSGAITGSSTKLGDNILLPNVVNNSVTSTQLTQTGNARVYNDVSVPLTTDHFLFYGKAIDGNQATTSITTPAEPFTYGTLDAQGLSGNTPGGITFTPKAIYTGDLTDNATATALLAYLNSIIGTTYTATGNTQATWKAYADASENSTKTLAELYNNFVKLTSGSSTSVEDAVQDLFTSVKGIPDNGLTADEIALRDAIVNSITSSTYVTNGTDATAETKLAFATTLGGYPASISLPDGAATLSYDATEGTFSANTTAKTLASNVEVAPLASFVYPANLWYFTSTPVRTSEAALSDQYTAGATWADILAKYGTTTGSVTTATRSIALENQIKYAVGRLHTVVKAGAATLYDRQNQPVEVSDETFPVTAILIGGQRAVNWQFTSSADDNTQYIMYDKAQSGNYAKVDNTTANNTLVLETPENKDINIVVELQNNSSKEFVGHDGNIPVGSKFYLVAKLNPETTSEVTQPGTGETTLTQVFKQGYVTNANLTISANSEGEHTNGLGAAYNVIPDLRTPVLSIGMSVDLSWQNGLTFNVNM